jgi:hypothetical protein
MQPLDPTPDLPDPQALASEFDVPGGDGEDMPDEAFAALYPVPSALPTEVACYGVACVEGVPDGADPKRMWAPGSLVFAPLPWSLKWQPSEEDAHEGAVVVGRVDQVWRDGNLIRWVGVLDGGGVQGTEAARQIAGRYIGGISIKADDVTESEVEYVYPSMLEPAVEMTDPDEMDGAVDGEAFHYPGKHDQKSHGYGGKKNVIKPMPKKAMSPAERRLRASHRQAPGSRRSSVQGGLVAHGDGGEDFGPGGMGGAMMPDMCILHHGRIRSLTIVAEPAFVECTISLGASPFPPIAAPEVSPLAELDAMANAELVEPAPIVAAGFSINIPELWPEWWFAEPSAEEMAMVSSGAVYCTPEGRVWGLLAPSAVDHRAFRGRPRPAGHMGEWPPRAPRNIDYSEWQNKACIVAGGDGGVYKISAGTVTFGCGHASPTDPRRADPNWAAQHYDNSCSVAMRARAGENRYGTWFAGGLAHGLTASSFEQIMGCALSGDWQGGKLKAALLVPVEGFPTAVTASVRERMGTLVASSVPIVFAEPEPDRSMDWVFDLVASALYDEAAIERYNELSRELGRG